MINTKNKDAHRRQQKHPQRRPARLMTGLPLRCTHTWPTRLHAHFRSQSSRTPQKQDVLLTSPSALPVAGRSDVGKAHKQRLARYFMAFYKWKKNLKKSEVDLQAWSLLYRKLLCRPEHQTRPVWVHHKHQGVPSYTKPREEEEKPKGEGWACPAAGSESGRSF